MRLLLSVGIAALVISFIATTQTQSGEPEKYFVSIDLTPKRLAPSDAGKQISRLYRQEVVLVFERRGDWARISNFHKDIVDGSPDMVAQWVKFSDLSKTRPDDLPQPPPLNDPRIDDSIFPKVGSGGITVEDVELLRKGALKYLNSRKCKKIDLAEKSVSRPGVYFISCDNIAVNHYFTKNDVQ